MEEIDRLLLDPPGRTDAVVRPLGRGVSGVPALDHALERLRQLVDRAAAEPLHLDDAAAGWRWPLQPLGGPGGLADLGAHLHQLFEWEPLRVERFAFLPDPEVFAQEGP